jgi:hypothetical protein
MKKLMILIFLTFAFGNLFFAQYEYERDSYDDYRYDRSYYDEQDYDENYLAYNYGYESAIPYLNQYSGQLYCWIHPFKNLYFIAIGRRIFIIPSFEISRIRRYHRWNMLDRDNFISLTCFGLPYYDNYIRFNYYTDYYRRHRYNRYNNIRIRINYHNHYRNRRRNSSYYRNYRTVIRSRKIYKNNNPYRTNRSIRYKNNSNTAYKKSSEHYQSKSRVKRSRSYSSYSPVKSRVKRSKSISYRTSSGIRHPATKSGKNRVLKGRTNRIRSKSSTYKKSLRSRVRRKR